jgi:hypothetical protein
MLSQGLIVRGNSTDRNEVFNIQTKVLRIMAQVRNRVSCRNLIELAKAEP